MQKIILHIDMDAFFAAVEQLDFPEYRGKPVIVGADPKDGKGRGVASTCSYEARKYGIHSAMPISQAYKRCPQGIYVRGRMERYQEVSRQVMKILNDFSPQMEPISIDEAFLDISGCIRLLGSPKEIGLSVKNRIKNELHLTASVGIAPSKFIAKIASDLEKPDGLVIVEPENQKQFLRPLPISRMWGVGKKTEPILQVMGIKTIGDLADFSQKKVIDKLGKNGLHFWYLANGIDKRDVSPYEGAKSISQEITFDEDTRDVKKLKHTLFYLSNELSQLMRKDCLKSKTITLKIRLEDFSTFTRSKSISFFTSATDDIYKIAIELFNNFYDENYKIRLIGIAASNLNCQVGEQISIFNNTDVKKEKADIVMDKIKEKFGQNSVKKASLMNTKSYRLTDKKVSKPKRSRP